VTKRIRKTKSRLTAIIYETTWWFVVLSICIFLLIVFSEKLMSEEAYSLAYCTFAWFFCFSFGVILLLLSFCFWLDIIHAKKKARQSLTKNISSHFEKNSIHFNILNLLKYVVLICIAIIGCICIINAVLDLVGVIF
jgi:hypothetical protein